MFIVILGLWIFSQNGLGKSCKKLWMYLQDLCANMLADTKQN